MDPRWAAAWSAHDPDAVARLFHEDGEYDDVAFGIVNPGRRGAREWATGFLASFPDLHVAIVAAYAAGTLEVVEWRMSGTQLGEFDEHPPTGRHFDVRSVGSELAAPVRMHHGAGWSTQGNRVVQGVDGQGGGHALTHGVADDPVAACVLDRAQVRACPARWGAR
jgi:SnoaL-like polyketide cyclase